MAGIAQERTAIGQHTHKTTQQTKNGKCIHLLGHTIELIIEPPTGTKLNFTRARTVLEIAEHGCNHFIGARVQTIEYGTREPAFHIQLVEEVAH